MSDSPTTSDHALAALLAREAGEVLLALREEIGTAPYDPKALKNEGDQVAQELLARRLGELAPGDAVLSEEATDDSDRLVADRVWIIDPLDGTKEYSERDVAGVWRDDWAVHVALWTKTDGLSAGAVALPARGQVQATPTPHINDLEPLEGRPLRLAASRSHPSAAVLAVAEQLGAELVPMGSAGVKAMAVLDGTVDAYVHAGGQYQWDSAAPVVVARAAGCETARIDGSNLLYNGASSWLPDLIVCRPGLMPTIRQAIDAAHVLEGLEK